MEKLAKKSTALHCVIYRFCAVP